MIAMAIWTFTLIWPGSMRSMALALAMLAASFSALSAAAQSGDSPTWSLKASTPSAKLVGEWQFAKAHLSAKGAHVDHGQRRCDRGAIGASAVDMQLG